MKEQFQKPSTVALALGLLLLLVLTGLLLHGDIGSGVYTTLFAVSSVVCLSVYGFPRLKHLDLKNMKLELQKIESVKKEIYAKEEDMKKVSLLISEFILYASIWHSRLGSNDVIEANRKWFDAQTERILDALRIPDKRRNEILGWSKLFDELDACPNNDSKRKEVWNRVRERIMAHGERNGI